MSAFQQPLAAVEDYLQDLRAMATLALHASETTEQEDWGKMRDSINTALYLMLDKIEQLSGTHETMWRAEVHLQHAERLQ